MKILGLLLEASGLYVLVGLYVLIVNLLVKLLPGLYEGMAEYEH